MCVYKLQTGKTITEDKNNSAWICFILLQRVKYGVQFRLIRWVLIIQSADPLMYLLCNFCYTESCANSGPGARAISEKIETLFRCAIVAFNVHMFVWLFFWVKLTARDSMLYVYVGEERVLFLNFKINDLSCSYFSCYVMGGMSLYTEWVPVRLFI